VVSIIDFSGVRYLQAYYNVAQSGGFLALGKNNGERIDILNIEAVGNTAMAQRVGDKQNGGGAIYVNEIESGLNIGKFETDRDILFIGNTAFGEGGAIYLINSTVSINAKNVKAVFKDNQSRQLQSNDIYVEGRSNLLLNVDTTGSIELYSGIMGSTQSMIDKNGQGTAIVSGYIKYLGSFDIREGTVLIDMTQLKDGKKKVNTAEIGRLTTREMTRLEFIGDGRFMGKVRLDRDSSIGGTLKLNANIAKGTSDAIEMISASGIDIEERQGAKLEVEIYGGIGNSSTTIIRGDISGYFANYVPISGGYGRVGQSYSESGEQYSAGLYNVATKLRYYSNRVDLMINGVSNFNGYISGLTHNEREVAQMFDSMTDAGGIGDLATAMSILGKQEDAKGDRKFEGTKKILDKVSGSFIARAITGALEDDSEEKIYNKMKELTARDAQRKTKEVWAQAQGANSAYEGEEAIGKSEQEMVGVVGGIQAFKGENSIGGIYAEYRGKKVKEDTDKASVNDIEMGLYGGWYRDNKVNIKGIVGIGISAFDINRNIALPDYESNPTLSGNAYILRANAQGEYVINVTDSIDIKPYIGIKNVGLFSEDMQEVGSGDAQVSIKSKAYIRSKGIVGIGIGDEKGDLKWNIRGYGGYVLLGNVPQYEISLSKAQGSKEMEIYASDSGVEIGVGGAIEYQWTQKVATFINANKSYGQDFERYYINAGINYGLGKSSRERMLEADGRAIELVEKARQIEYEAQEVKVIKMLAAEFETGSYALSRESKESIREAAQRIKELDYTMIVIGGYTDAVGSEKSNKNLSLMRAKAVYEELYRNGIALKSMRYIGFKGIREPIASNETDIGKARNRRAEIVVEYVPNRQKTISAKERYKAVDQNNNRRKVIQITQIQETINQDENEEEYQNAETLSPRLLPPQEEEDEEDEDIKINIIDLDEIN
jgi:outer membrane protein OmpA-like peptidoglycan-associated protein